ncbi:hypothetical protein GWG54_19425 [Natronococcus sp. JC468]|uniref:hypothetical protein n=1 Tax=Natronococcus sp. JC468 TaxID=1961921 RepID=UPI00143924C3|nr:hypothetical protein [Natronococcus sp. JC468]NKE37926.1 hypothetical protein [Natronococcus sp. JC468]
MGVNDVHDGLNVRYNPASWFVTAIGVVLGIAGLTYLITHPEPLIVLGTELVLIGGPVAAIVYGGYWLAAHQLPDGGRWNIAKWCLGGTGVAALLFLGYANAEQFGGGTVIDPALLIILGALSGGVVSLFAAISNERQHLNLDTGEKKRLVEEGVEPFSDDAQTFATLVADARSWDVIRAVKLAEEPLGVEVIATQIAAREETDIHDVHIDLIHRLLPKLADERLIHYEPDVDVVWSGERLDAVVTASEELSVAGEQLTTSEQ